jgi:hypothetical protein
MPSGQRRLMAEGHAMPDGDARLRSGAVVCNSSGHAVPFRGEKARPGSPRLRRRCGTVMELIRARISRGHGVPARVERLLPEAG